jgi:hypothetical protein
MEMSPGEMKTKHHIQFVNIERKVSTFKFCVYDLKFARNILESFCKFEIVHTICMRTFLMSLLGRCRVAVGTQGRRPKINECPFIENKSWRVGRGELDHPMSSPIHKGTEYYYTTTSIRHTIRVVLHLPSLVSVAAETVERALVRDLPICVP